MKRLFFFTVVVVGLMLMAGCHNKKTAKVMGMNDSIDLAEDNDSTIMVFVVMVRLCTRYNLSLIVAIRLMSLLTMSNLVWCRAVCWQATALP